MSLQVVVSHLSYSYKSAVDVLQDVCIAIPSGWHGVVGANGSGKTTFLEAIAGVLPVERTFVKRVPSDMLVRYCPQRVETLTTEICGFAGRSDGEALGLKDRLRLAPEDLDRWESLSPGERKRWQIAAAVAESPEMLLLDEPTNHIDADARRLLLSQLRSFRGIGLLVSHDRELLDELTDSTIKVGDEGTVEAYNGCYTEARSQWRAEARQRAEAREQAKLERRKVKRRLDAARRAREGAEKGKSTRKRMKGPRDSDARSMAAKGKVASAESKLGRSVSVLREKLERAEQSVASARVGKQVGRSVFVLEDVAPKGNLIRFVSDRVEVCGRSLLRDVSLNIRRDSRVHLTGPNGSGKTTLIGRLLAASDLPDRRVLYLPQELSGEQTDFLRGEVKLLDGETKGRLMQIVAALGVPPDRLMASEKPSPGEARKLKLAIGLSRQVWLLVLDEPTNHLDLPSIERMEEALAAYSGALLLVSHDTRFARTLTTEQWKIQDQKLRLEIGCDCVE